MFQDVDPVVEQLIRGMESFDAFDQQLAAELQQPVYQHLCEWVGKSVEQDLTPIAQVVSTRTEELAELVEQAEKGQTDDQARRRVQRFYELVEPGAIADGLARACELRQATIRYTEVMQQLEAAPQAGELARRYRLPPELVTRLARAATAPLEPALDALRDVSRTMNDHASLLRQIQEEKGMRSGMGVAAAVAGGVLLGPLGAIGGRILSEMATDPTAQMDESSGRVGNAFDIFCAEFFAGLEVMQSTLAYVYASVYGGLLLRLDQDLRALGRSLLSVDLQAGRVVPGMSREAFAAFDKWATDTLKELTTLRRSGEWGRLGSAADAALRWIVSDPLRVTAVGDREQTAYVVRFARMRAAALNRAADQAWTDGMFTEARELYRHLLRGTNVAAERDNESTLTPQDEALHIAGLRLAIVATADRSSKETDEDLAALPAFVMQALARFASPEPFMAAPGEALSPDTIVVANSIMEFASEFGHPLDLHGMLPELLDGQAHLGQWQSLVEGHAQYSMYVLGLIDEQTISGHEDRSRYLGWLQDNAAREWRQNQMNLWARRLTIGAAAVALVLLIIFLAT